jgi:hypothetical protein
MIATHLVCFQPFALNEDRLLVELERTTFPAVEFAECENYRAAGVVSGHATDQDDQTEVEAQAPQPY